MSELFLFGFVGLVGYGLLGMATLPCHHLARSDLRWLTTLAFLYRLTIMGALYLALLKAGTDGFAYVDDLRFHETSLQLADAWRGGFAYDPGVLKNEAYYFLTAGLYVWVSASTLVARMVNVIISCLALIVLYELAFTVWGRKTARRVTFVCALLPDLAFWSGLQFKDTIVSFLVLWSLLFVARAMKDERSLARNIAFAVSGVIALYFFRAESALVLFASVALAAIMHYRRLKPKQRTLIFSATVAAVIVAIPLLALAARENWLVGGAVVTRLVTSGSLPADFTDFLNYIRDLRDQGLIATGFIIQFSDIWRLPIAMLFVGITPFPPWPSSDLTAQNLLTLASIPWLVMTPLVLVGIYREFRTGSISGRPLLYYVTAQWTALALFLYAFSPPRHRVELVPLAVAVALAHLPHRASWDGKIWAAGVVMIAGLCVLYVVL